MKNPKIPTVSFCSFSLFQTKTYIGAITKCGSYSSWMKKYKRTRGLSHHSLAIYIKRCLKAKRRIMEIQIFHHAIT
jgi:hypothetical protein